MKLAIMQPYLFPYIGYFQLIKAADKFVLLDDVNFINRGWINRNKILLNGKEHLFTIPLENASQNKLIKDINIVNDKKWRNKFLTTIDISYKKAPFFKESFDILNKIISADIRNISDYIYNSLVIINKYINIKTPIIKTSSAYNNQHLKGQDKILDICLREKAESYINPIGGIEIYKKESFLNNNITLHFLKTGEIEYKQLNNEFIPLLSIIDVMMFNSKQIISNFLEQYTLISNE